MPLRLPTIILLLAAPIAATAGSPLTPYALGCLHQHRGEPAIALDFFSASLHAAPDSLAPANRIARLRLAAGDLAAASATLREFATTHPDHLDAQLAYAAFLTESSPGDSIARRLAIEALERARGHFPHHPLVLERLFLAYENAGRRDDSLALFRSQLDSAQGDATLASTLIPMARTLFPGNSQEGRQVLDDLHRRAIEAAPRDPLTARAASEHFRTTGRILDAIDILAHHTTEAPESLDLRVRLGILQFAADLGEEGEATLKEVLVIHPRKLLAHQALAKFYRRNNQSVKARQHTIELLKLRGGSAREFLQLADDLLAENLPRDARLLLEKAVYHHPDNPELARRRAIASRRDPQTADSCSRLFREAAALTAAETPDPPPDPAFLVEFAEALIADGQSAAAEQRLRDAIRQFPADQKPATAAALRRLAGLWHADGRHPEATRALLQRAESLER